MSEQRWVMLNRRRQPLPTDGRRLVDWLRGDMGLAGTKEPCGSGQCGGCSVLLDGDLVLACCLLATTMAGRELTTIEGLAEANQAEPLLQAFVDHGAIQCGYCTPGMIMAARAFLDRVAAERVPSLPIDERQVREALSGNLCRCTGYVQIVEAVLAAAQTEGLPCARSSGVRWRLLSDDLRAPPCDPADH